jgi:hypothetical protein
MDTCLIRFERIEILATSRAGARADNDWLLLHWFVGGQPQPPQVMPLRNASGSAALAAGDVIPPFACACPLVASAHPTMAAVFLVVELGAYPAVEQSRQAIAASRRIGAALTEAYVEATEWMAEVDNRMALEARGAGADAPSGAIATAFIEEALNRLAWCDWRAAGMTPVLHDAVAFASATTGRTLERTYPADGQAACVARTALRLTQERRPPDADSGRSMPLA